MKPRCLNDFSVVLFVILKGYKQLGASVLRATIWSCVVFIMQRDIRTVATTAFSFVKTRGFILSRLVL